MLPITPVRLAQALGAALLAAVFCGHAAGRTEAAAAGACRAIAATLPRIAPLALPDPPGGALVGNRPRVIVSTDVGGSDPDDFQSLVHFLVHSSLVETEGLISSPPGAGRVQHILETLAAYEQDYDRLRSHSPAFAPPEALQALAKQGAISVAPAAGFSTPTEGSNWIIQQARRNTDRPLYILVWGSITDVAQAIHDDPGIKSLIRVYSIGSWNTQQDPNARNYLYQNHNDFWWVEADTTFRGMYVGGDQSGDLGNLSFVQQHVKSHGALGDFFWSKKPDIKMGDTPSLMYLLRGDPEAPAADHWGGRFRADSHGTRYWRDLTDPQYAEGVYPGAKTVNQWRENYLREWQRRMDWAASAEPVYPGAAWDFMAPAEAGMDVAGLDALRDYVGGRGCVVRYGHMVYTWGDQSFRQDVASACKPWISHFLFKAVEDGRLGSLDDLVRTYQPCLDSLNPALGYKDRRITFRHMANQISCYGVREAPGTAFDYNDWQMALFWDTLFLGVYGAAYANVDATVLHPLLTDVLQCEDSPTFLAFGTADRPGRVRISVRDFARFGLLYLRGGKWMGTQLISPEHASLAVTSPLPNSIPRTAGLAAEMCPDARSLGSTSIPDNQTDHEGSYSWAWWTNGVNRSGERHFPDAPLDTFGAFGHANGQRAVAVIPSLDLVVSWNDTTLGSKPGNPNEALKRLVEAVVLGGPFISLDPNMIAREVDYRQNLPDDAFTITNSGSGVLHYVVEPDQPWLSVVPTGGSSSGQPDLISLSYATSDLSIGMHEATIRVSDSGSVPPAVNSPQEIRIAVRVKTVLPDLDLDGDVDQDDFGEFQVCFTPAGQEVSPECLPADFNADGIVFLNDFNAFQHCLSGPDVPADASCDDELERGSP